MKKRLSCLCSNCSKIHLVDGCLILFMLILLVESAITLISNQGVPESNSIDIIVRTSAAAIFGYFMSANFIRHSKTSKKNTLSEPGTPPQLTPEKGTKSNTPQNRIGFAASPKTEPLTPGGTNGQINLQETFEEINEEATEGKLQIIVTAAVGLFCLIVLIVVRNVPAWENAIESSSSATATVAQFRDFISGGIGFLIGCPTNRQDNS